MPTSKKRINISIPRETAIFLKKLSIRDDVPQATKAAQLLEKALEMEEDEYFATHADSRAAKSRGWMTHRTFWSKVL